TRLPDVNVMPLLLEALNKPGNWQSAAPPQLNLLVVTKDLTGITDAVLVHPFSTLTVTQKVVPLGVEISRFGSAKPAGAKRFSINGVTTAAGPLAVDPAKEQFAPAQFEQLSDADKLSRRSFESMPAGVRTQGSGLFKFRRVVTRNLVYEPIIIDRWGRRLALQLKMLASSLFSLMLNGNAVAESALSQNRKANSALAPAKVKVSEGGFAVVGVSDMKLAGQGGAHGSEFEAMDAMRRLIAAQPELEGMIQVVPAHEAHT
ncbi:MAG: hypothetical protein IT323_14730, partial [Anaerolineae bacterium]|nr:hypothetical protein [Anaerolineae bacterium]